VLSGCARQGGELRVALHGHPLDASGVRVVSDIARQLWGEAGVNQVEGARVGLAQMLGGVLTGIESPVVAGIQIMMI